jgi:hypothetical protein
MQHSAIFVEGYFIAFKAERNLEANTIYSVRIGPNVIIKMFLLFI